MSLLEKMSDQDTAATVNALAAVLGVDTGAIEKANRIDTVIDTNAYKQQLAEATIDAAAAYLKTLQS